MRERARPDGGLRLAVLTRATTPLHGVGGLERSTHDLVEHLLDRGVRITLLTRPPTRAAEWSRPGLSFRFVPYVTFPFAGRRGTTILDRSTAYPLFGQRLGREAARLAAGRHGDRRPPREVQHHAAGARISLP